MSDRPTFETQLRLALTAYASDAPVDIDPISMAASAFAAGKTRRGIRVSERGRSRWLPLLVAALLIAILAVSALIAGRGLVPAPFAGELVFSRFAGGIYVARPDGTEARQVVAGARCLKPRWSPDKTLIAAECDDPTDLQGGTQRLMAVRPDGSLVLDISSTSGLLDFAWAQDDETSHRLAATIDERLVLIDLDRGSRLVIPPRNAPYVSSLVWSSVEPILYVATSPEGGLVARTAGTITEIRLPIGISDVPEMRATDVAVDAGDGRRYRALYEPDVSPDGRSIAYRARIEAYGGSHAVIVPLDGRAPWRSDEMLSGWTWGTDGMRWTADGRGLIADGVREQLVTPIVVPTDGGPVRRLVPPDPEGRSWYLVDGGEDSSHDAVVLVGRETREQFDGPSGSVLSLDLWAVGEDGTGLRQIASGVIGADLD